MVVFDNEMNYGYRWCCIMMLWPPSGGLALDDGYMWFVDVFFSIDIIYDDWGLSYLGFPKWPILVLVLMAVL